MEKGTSKNILCDTCRTITTNDYVTVKGKKRVLHYCNSVKCIDFDKQVESLGYKRLSNKTWSEHCEKCKSHPVGGCANLSPNCNEFYDQIVFQKKYNSGDIKNITIEIARPKKKINNIEWGSRISEYTVGFVFVNPNNPNTVRRMFYEFLGDRTELVPFIIQCEKEIDHTIFFLKHS